MISTIAAPNATYIDLRIFTFIATSTTERLTTPNGMVPMIVASAPMRRNNIECASGMFFLVVEKS